MVPTFLHILFILSLIYLQQYTFYTLSVENLTSNFEDAFDKATELASLLSTITNKNETVITEEESKLTSLQNKLKKTVDTVLNYKIDETDPAYRLFNEINKKQFLSVIYLTRITAMVNKLAMAIDKLKAIDINNEYSEDEVKNVGSEISIISKIFKRRPHEAIALHFDVMTYVLSSDDGNLDLVTALDAVCNDFKNNDTSKNILNEGPRTINQICSKQYNVIYGAIHKVIVNDYDEAKRSLFNLVNTLQDSDDHDPDVFKFFNDR